jgi:hypothetical protein
LREKLYAVREKLYAVREKLYAVREKLYAGREKLYAGREKLYAVREKLYAGREKLYAGREKLYAGRAKLFAKVSHPFTQAVFQPIVRTTVLLECILQGAKNIEFAKCEIGTVGRIRVNRPPHCYNCLPCEQATPLLQLSPLCIDW